LCFSHSCFKSLIFFRRFDSESDDGLSQFCRFSTTISLISEKRVHKGQMKLKF
jgi:hypothetical protein